jgi:hypothetical protein
LWLSEESDHSEMLNFRGGSNYFGGGCSDGLTSYLKIAASSSPDLLSGGNCHLHTYVPRSHESKSGLTHARVDRRQSANCGARHAILLTMTTGDALGFLVERYIKLNMPI